MVKTVIASIAVEYHASILKTRKAVFSFPEDALPANLLAALRKTEASFEHYGVWLLAIGVIWIHRDIHGKVLPFDKNGALARFRSFPP